MQSTPPNKFFLILIVVFISITAIRAQIIYTDVSPDVTINNNGTYPLDLNNDGIVDFNISYTNTFPGACSDIAQLNYHVRITPANFNATANDNNIPLQPIILDSNLIIGKNLIWKKDPNQLLFSMNWICQNEYWVGYSNGYWINTSNKFLPLKLRMAGSTYFGWLGIDVEGYNTSFGSFKIRDYACNAVAGRPILTGESVCIEPLVAHTNNGPLSFCTGDSVILTANANAYSYQWKRNGVNIIGATSSSYTAKTAGIYKVRVANSCGSKTSMSKTVTTPCKMTEDISLPDETAHLFVYPNPALNQHLTIQLPTDDESTIQIMSVYGQIIFSSITASTELFIDVSNFTSGIYTVRWISGENTESKTFSVIK